MEKYIAILRKVSSSDFGVEFPDLPGCYSAGSTLEEARAMASEALRLHIDGLREDGMELPPSTGLDSIEKRLRKRRGDDFYALVEVEAEQPAPKIVRVNISLDEKLLREIDTAASAAGVTRSGFLAEAVRRTIRRSTKTQQR